MLTNPPPAFSGPPALNRQTSTVTSSPGIQNQISSRKPTGALSQGMPALSQNPLTQQQDFQMLLKLLQGGGM